MTPRSALALVAASVALLAGCSERTEGTATASPEKTDRRAAPAAAGAAAGSGAMAGAGAAAGPGAMAGAGAAAGSGAMAGAGAAAGPGAMAGAGAAAGPGAMGGSAANAPAAAVGAQGEGEGDAQGDGEPAGPRIHSRARFAWINPGPGPNRGWLGYLGLGGSVALRGGSAEAARTYGPGCEGWYAVEPQGYVCAGAAATLDAADPVVVALRRDAPRVTSPWPYEYAESIGAPRYAGVPSEGQQRAVEWDLEKHLADVARAREAKDVEAIRAINEALVGVDLGPSGEPMPELFAFGGLVREARKRIVEGSTIAFTRAFDAGGRSWVLTSDQAIMPRDRMKPYPRSTFEGVWLRDGRALPLAFFRKSPRPKYRRGAGGAFEATGEAFARLAWVGLTGAAEGEGEQRFLETREPGIWVLEADATVLEAAKQPPLTREAEPGAPARKWLDISVLGGWLVAYEERTPVFATLISPGRGGIPTKGVPAIETAATPTGTFRVDGKFATATLVSSTNELIVHSEVQFVQNFSGPHALHGAYWHDAWGEPKSGGCVNLSPIDAKQVFEWTDPPLPAGWHGMRAVKELGGSTVVRIHR